MNETPVSTPRRPLWQHVLAGILVFILIGALVGSGIGAMKYFKVWPFNHTDTTTVTAPIPAAAVGNHDQVPPVVAEDDCARFFNTVADPGTTCHVYTTLKTESDIAIWDGTVWNQTGPGGVKKVHNGDQVNCPYGCSFHLP